MMSTIRKFEAPAGAEVVGADLAGELDERAFATIDAALNEHSVIVLRGQAIGPEQLLRFTRRFGALEINAFNKFALPSHREVLVVSNIIEAGRSIGYADAGTHWHTDMSYTATPPRCTLLYAIEVPEADGVVLGDTLFAHVGAAYDALSTAMKQRLDGLQAIHRFSAKPRGLKKAVELSAAQIERYPDVAHPVVRTHPQTGRKCLYVHSGECIAIPGLAEAEALALIQELSAHCTRPEFIYRHRWRAGDLLIWDNCAVQHLAIRDYEWPQRRLMHRTTVNGSVPF